MDRRHGHAARLPSRPAAVPLLHIERDQQTIECMMLLQTQMPRLTGNQTRLLRVTVSVFFVFFFFVGLKPNNNISPITIAKSKSRI